MSIEPAINLEVPAVWQWSGSVWRCSTHGKQICTPCHRLSHRPARRPKIERESKSAPPLEVVRDEEPLAEVLPVEVAPVQIRTTAAPRGRQKLSEAGVRTDSGLQCPKCGGAQFTAKRSKKGKVLGFTTLGVGGLVAPKSQVKCVTCGTMYKRG